VGGGKGEADVQGEGGDGGGSLEGGLNFFHMTTTLSSSSSMLTVAPVSSSVVPPIGDLEREDVFFSITWLGVWGDDVSSSSLTVIIVEEGTKGSGRDVRGIKGKRHGSRAWKMAEGAKKGKDTGAVKSKHLLLFDTNGQRVSTTRRFYVCHRLSRVSNVRLTQK
jgi:hypothetical protein